MVEHEAGEFERLPGPVSDGRSVSVGPPNGEDQALGARFRRAVDQACEAVAVQIDAALIEGDQAVSVAQLGEDSLGLFVSDRVYIATEGRGLEGDLFISEVLGKAPRVLVVCRVGPLDSALADPDACDFHGRA